MLPQADSTSEWKSILPERVPPERRGGLHWCCCRDSRCTGIFGAAATAAAGCDDAFGGQAVDAFDDALLEELAEGAPLEVMEAALGAGDLLFVPAGVGARLR